MAEPDQAVTGNGDPLDSLSADKRPVGAAGIFEQPVIAFLTQHGMLPGHPSIGYDNVRVRVTPDPVTGPCWKHPVRPLRSHVKRLVTR
jgi:hypothetical protein